MIDGTDQVDQGILEGAQLLLEQDGLIHEALIFPQVGGVAGGAMREQQAGGVMHAAMARLDVQQAGQTLMLFHSCAVEPGAELTAMVSIQAQVVGVTRGVGDQYSVESLQPGDVVGDGEIEFADGG